MPLFPNSIKDEHWRSIVDAYLKMNGLSDQVVRSRDVGISYAKAVQCFESQSEQRLRCPQIRGFRHPHSFYALNSKGRLRFCPLCRSEDLTRYGYARWRNTHQAYVCKLCPDHGCLLLEGCGQCGYAPGKWDELDACSDCCPDCSARYPVRYPTCEGKERQLMFTRFIQAVFLEQLAHPSGQPWIALLKHRAMEKFRVSERGIPARLRREIERTFSDEWLCRIGYHPRMGAGAGWLKLFFLGLGYGRDIYANALIGSILFESLNEWQDLLTSAASLHFVCGYEPYVRTMRMEPYLMKEIAWHASLRSIATKHYLNIHNLESMVMHLPELRAARATPFMQARLALLKGKYRLLGGILKTRSSKKILLALHRAETRYSGKASTLSSSTIELAHQRQVWNASGAVAGTGSASNVKAPIEDVLAIP